MEDRDISVGNMDMLGIKEVALGLLKSPMEDKFPGPDVICPRLLREARDNVA